MGNIGSSDDETVVEETKRANVERVQKRPRRKQKRFLKIGKIAVSVFKGSITDQTTDVIVIGTTPKLELNKAKTSKLVLDAAGNSVQDECTQKYPSGISFGDVAIVGPGKLDCQYIFFVILQKYTDISDAKHLETCIQNCLNEADKLGMTSISFPALGSGFLGYPPKVVATSMFHALETFDTTHLQTSIRIANCIVYNEDAFKEILAEAKARATSKETKQLHQHCHSSSVICTIKNSSHSIGLETLSLITRASCSCNFGKVHVSVIVDSITTQIADIIVCTCAKNLKLSSRSGLSKQVSDTAGSALQLELDSRHPNGIDVEDLVVANGYRLKCRKVYFGCLIPFFGKDKTDQAPEQILYNFVTKCLESASQHSCKSIAFPALGTGYLKFPPELAASKVIGAIKDFHSKNNQTSLREVKIVIFGGTSDWAKVEKTYIKCCAPRAQTPQGPQQPSSKPQRGSRAYFSWKYREEPKTPYYWTQFKSSKSIKEWTVIAKGNTCRRERPNDEIVKSITSTFMKTMRQNATIQSIERIENIYLFEQYIHECQRSFRKASVNGASTSLANTKGSRGEAESMTFLDKDIKKHLHSEINEVYLFHGTKRSLVDIITLQGFDDRLAKMNFGKLRLGNGIYSAEEAHVSHGYTDQNGSCKMFVMRVNLGDVFTTPTNIEKLTRPPCKSRCVGICTSHPDLFDSVVGDWPGYCREFTVYDRAKCYPEYIITYTVP